MSDFFEDENQQDESQGIKSLREAYKKATERLEQLEADARKRAVADLIPAGYDKGIANMYQGKPEEFQTWFENNKGLFVSQATSATAPVVEEPKQTGQPSIDPQTQAAMERLGEGETGAREFSGFDGDLEKLAQTFDKHGTNYMAAAAEWQGQTYGF